MAKAILGYVGSSSLADQHEIAQLRRRVADLSAEVARLQRENDDLIAVHAEHVEVELVRQSLAASH